MSDVRFLNVDLDVESRGPLDVLVDDLGDDVAVLHHGGSRGLYEAHFEIPYTGAADVEATIASFCTLLENLSPDAREVWHSCILRQFDIGFESGDTPTCFQAVIHQDSVKRVANLGATIVITIYPRRGDDI